MKSAQWGGLALDAVGALLYAYLGIYWVCYAGRDENWIWYLLLGLVCLALFGRSLVKAIRGLHSRIQKPEEEDMP